VVGLTILPHGNNVPDGGSKEFVIIRARNHARVPTDSGGGLSGSLSPMGRLVVA